MPTDPHSVTMDLDELRAVQNKERQKDSLQHLRESFYGDVADYVATLEEQRERAAEAAEDPFAAPEVRQLTDEIETVREVAEAIYERRLGKLVKRASLAAADMPADAEGLTTEERELFDDIVDRIEVNKDRVLDVVEGEADSDPSESGTASGASEPTVDAATAMGDATATESDGRPVPPEASTDPGSAPGGETGGNGAPAGAGTEAGDRGSNSPADGTTDGPRAGPGESPGGLEEPSDGLDEPSDGRTTSSEGSDASTMDLDGLDDRTTVRITDDVGEIFGVDDRDYELSTDDVVTLPAANAEPLLERDAAERIE